MMEVLAHLINANKIVPPGILIWLVEKGEIDLGANTEYYSLTPFLPTVLIILIILNIFAYFGIRKGWHKLEND
jgi:hypothetical protein